MKINDLVSRKSYNNDILFRIIDIRNDKYILKGEELRLFADATIDDLKIEEKRNINITLPRLNVDTFQSSLKGKVLHLDGDAYYLKKAQDAYKAYNIPAKLYYVKEIDMPYAIKELLKRESFDIVVVTGHDSFKGKAYALNDMNAYSNSLNYLHAVEEARKFNQDKDSLVIIAGACQSNFESLIEAGANFASSPRRQNIHLLDPIILAASISLQRVDKYINVNEILKTTISHELGGIDTKGKARRMF